MRAIDSENLYKFLTDQRVKERGAYSKGLNTGLDIARSALRNEQIAPTLTQPNDPLTLEQIKSLYDSPAWYQDLYRKMGYWIIVGVIGEIGVHLTDLDNANEFYSTIDYGARWALFRRPPDGL